MEAYQALEQRFREIGHLEHVEAILFWDEAAMMPPGGGPARAGAMSALAGVIHERTAMPDIGDLLAQADASADGLDPWQQANLAQMKRTWRHATALPGDLVKASQLATMTCEQTWRRYRPLQDWEAVRPKLEEVLRLKQEAAQRLGEAEGLAPYDALLDIHEEGLRSDLVERHFADLGEFLPGFLEEVLERQGRRLLVPLDGPFPTERQRAVGVELIGALGFDFDHGRLDISHHPFCGGVPDDTRITTRYREDDFLPALMGMLHEAGHGLYQQGLPADWREQPVGDALGAAVHESQSLLMEMQVCRSRAFLDFATPRIREGFGADPDDPAWSRDNLLAHYTRVRRGYIRVDADEVTYPLHIILRFEIERALIAGDMAVGDIPEAWDERMQSLLGLSTAGNLKDGCMQDVHWFCGAFGYFPTYTLGALTAAQLFAAARKQVTGLDDAIRQGDFHPLLDWLRANVHGQGRLRPAGQMLTEVTGQPLSTEPFKRHLRSRYLSG
jgi:carboxypeptidase Taq